MLRLEELMKKIQVFHIFYFASLAYLTCKFKFVCSAFLFRLETCIHYLTKSSHWFPLQSLGSLVAFQAMVSVATVGIYIAYALPILFRVTLARKSFIPGPFSLGRYSILVGWVAVLWVATITVLFSLPVAYPVTKETLNYTPVAVGGVLLLAVSSWILSARQRFKGPTTYIAE